MPTKSESLSAYTYTTYLS